MGAWVAQVGDKRSMERGRVDPPSHIDHTTLRRFLMWNLFKSLFRSSKTGRQLSALAAATRNPKRRTFLALETLEDRCVPTLLSVTSSADNINVAGTLRYEVAHAHNGDTIQIAGARTIVLTQGELVLSTNLTIEGQGSAATISGDHQSSVFEVASRAKVSLSDLNITNGDALIGGGISNSGTLTVNDCVLSSNVGIFAGGAIFNLGTLAVSSSTLSGNSAGEGGGICNDGGTVTVSGACLLTGNTGSSGGGLYNTGASLQVSNCFILSNTAAQYLGDGGGICNASGNLTVTNCDIGSNSAGHGGGIYNDGMATITGTYLYNNSAALDGGGMVNDLQGTLVVATSTLAGNSSQVAGGIYSDGTAKITGTTLRGNECTMIGGGICNGGALQLSGDTLVDNVAGNGGGAICVEAGFVWVGDCSFSGNSPDTINGPYISGGANTGL
jgi:hypothetical protein